MGAQFGDLQWMFCYGQGVLNKFTLSVLCSNSSTFYYVTYCSKYCLNELEEGRRSEWLNAKENKRQILQYNVTLQPLHINVLWIHDASVYL